jgi:hypothetical protein
MNYLRSAMEDGIEDVPNLSLDNMDSSVLWVLDGTLNNWLVQVFTDLYWVDQGEISPL